MLWEVEELQKLSDIQPEIVGRALSDLWKFHPELHRDVVTSAYLDEKINLSKAAELLRMDRRKLAEEFKVQGIPIRNLSKEDVLAEVEALRSW